MKKQNLRIFLMFGLLAILAPLSAHAQSGNVQTADIPFSFTVGDKSFPAGRYIVTRVNPASSQAVLAIKSADGRMSKLVLTNDIQAARTSAKAKLVFNHYGERYYLSQVWTPADRTGLQLPKSRSERALARNNGQREPERTTIALSSHRR